MSHVGNFFLHHDEAMQRLTTQHASVVPGCLLGAEEQDTGKGRDWLERDGVAWLSGAQVGPLSTVDGAHLNIANV